MRFILPASPRSGEFERGNRAYPDGRAGSLEVRTLDLSQIDHQFTFVVEVHQIRSGFLTQTVPLATGAVQLAGAKRTSTCRAR